MAMAEFHDTDEFRGTRFTAVDLSGARFRNVDLSGAKVVDAMLVNAAFSGLIDGLTINDIEVAPLIAAEMDRRYPERARLFARDPAGLRAAWSTLEAMWEATTDRARALPDALRRAASTTNGRSWRRSATSSSPPTVGSAGSSSARRGRTTRSPSRRASSPTSCDVGIDDAPSRPSTRCSRPGRIGRRWYGGCSRA